jgi:tryptophan halogenase
MSAAIQQIVIVGGGTAGWLSAVFLTAALSRMPDRSCRITLIESSDIGTIGVGEATVPTIKNIFKFCDIDEFDWMVQCNAGFKVAIRFIDWCGSTQADVFWHPFGQLPTVGGIPLSHHWLKRRLKGNREPFDYSCSAAILACDAKRSPKLPDHRAYESSLEYAYHLDAGLLATYLKHLGKNRGVKNVVDNVLEVVLDERGYVSHLRTESSGDLHGDLFLDCSGFRGLLINQALGEPFVAFSDALFCDSAIALPIPTDDRTHGMNPYTTATALNAGWAWHIPLFNRTGNGYVYSSSFISKDQAEQELRKHLGEDANKIDARHIRMRVGRTRNAWAKNCVSIGLASGFIEPLESTAIWFIELGLYNLIFNFPDKHFNTHVIAKYNAVMEKYYNQVRDFVILHYCTTKRDDTPFWRANKNHPAIPPSLKANLELWAAMLPNHEQLDELGFFKGLSYSSILAGMGRLPQRCLPILEYWDDAEADFAFQSIRQGAEQLRSSLPDHYQYLFRLRQNAGFPR